MRANRTTIAILALILTVAAVVANSLRSAVYESRAIQYMTLRGGSVTQSSSSPPRWWPAFCPYFSRQHAEQVLLHFEEIDDEVIARLQHLDHVKVLYLCGPQVTDKAIREIRHLSIESLHLNSSRVTDNGVAVLADMPSLIALQLNGTSITDDSIELLSRLPKLQHLTLHDTNVTDRGVLSLRASGRLRRLVVPQITSDNAICALTASLPACVVTR